MVIDLIAFSGTVYLCLYTAAGKAVLDAVLKQSTGSGLLFLR